MVFYFRNSFHSKTIRLLPKTASFMFNSVRLKLVMRHGLGDRTDSCPKALWVWACCFDLRKHQLLHLQWDNVDIFIPEVTVRTSHPRPWVCFIIEHRISIAQLIMELYKEKSSSPFGNCAFPKEVPDLYNMNWLNNQRNVLWEATFWLSIE